MTGASNTAAAAALLEEDANIKSKTVAALLLEKDRVVAERPKPQLWVIDEASMIGSKDASKLMAKARREGAQVVLVGDEAQIPAIAAGKPFSQLMAERKIDYATVDEILRQKDSALKQAVEQTIAGDDLAALKTMEKMEGAIKQIENRDERLQAVADAYLENQKSSMIITGTNRDRRDINDLVRSGLKEKGQLQGPSASADILVPKSMTEAELKNSRSYREGDVVRFGRSYKRMGIESGEYLMVARAGDSRGVVELRGSDGRTIEWRPLKHAKVEAFDRGVR